MIAFFRNLRKRLDQADKFEDERASFYEERLSHLADRIKELQELHAREQELVDQKLEIHDGRIKALDFWTQHAGQLVGMGKAPVDLVTEIETSGDPLDTESWDDEMNIMGMLGYPQPLGSNDGDES